MSILYKFTPLLKKRKKTFMFSFILILSILGWFLFSGSDSELEFAEANIGSVVQEVNITGRVKSAQSVDLAFERSGKISYVGVKSGDRVAGGRLLIKLDDSELLAQEQREKANVSASELRLNQIIASSKSGGDISSVIDSLARAVKSSIDAMIDFTDVQYKYFNNNYGTSVYLAQQKDEILYEIYNKDNLGRVGAWYFTAFNTGLKSEVYAAQANPNDADIDPLISKTKHMLLITKAGLEVMQSELAGQPNVDPADLNKIKSDIDTIITRISDTSILNKTVVGEGYDIEIAISQLEQAKASLALIQAQLVRYWLVSPFAGIVANVDVKPGEIISPNEVMVSLIGNAKFQIEANVSEADVAKISVGNSANVTLDAYGRDNIFKAKVIHIDPAGRMVEGLAVYKITLEFDSNDKRILSGLTADMDILTQRKDDVLYIPSRNVISKDGKKYVQVVIDQNLESDRFANLILISQEDGKKIFEVEIKTGLKGSDGRIEIISGLQEGDKIIRE